MNVLRIGAKKRLAASFKLYFRLAEEMGMEDRAIL